MSAPDRKAVAALEYLQLRGFYSTTYTAIVRPERVFAVTDYFRRYWVPLLKPGPAWLVVALRQHCYWNSQRDWCSVSRESLAQECGLAVRTVDNYLSLPLIDWFVTARQARYTVRDDRGATPSTRLQRDWTRYSLRLDEPLTPDHQAALAALARKLAQDSPAATPAGRTLDVAQRLLDMPGDELMQALEDGNGEALDRSVAPQTIRQILEEAVAATASTLTAEETLTSNSIPTLQPSHLPTLLSSACDALYLRIVRPDKVHIATQYFRTRWLPLLGTARAWLILHLRARCYFNARQLEVRDTCTVAGLGELAAALGISISTVKTCLSEPPASTFLDHLATRRPGRGQVQMTFRVEMIDPLTPEDQERSNVPDQEPESTLSSVQQPDSAGTAPDQQPDSASTPEQRPDFAGRPTDQQPDSAGIEGTTNSQILQSTKLPFNYISREITQQHQVLTRTTESEDENVDPMPIAAAAGSLSEILAWLQIDEPARSRIQALDPPRATVIAWAIEAMAQARITNKAGFIVAMLLGRLAPPPELEQLAHVPLGRWRKLVRACQLARVAGIQVGQGDQVDPDPLFWPLYDRLGRLSVQDWPIHWPDKEKDVSDFALPPDPPGLESIPAGAGLESASEPAGTRPAIPSTDLAVLWAQALDRLRGQMLALTFEAYLRDTRLVSISDGCWTIAAPYAYIRDWLQSRFTVVVRHAAHALAGRPVDVEFVVLE